MKKYAMCKRMGFFFLATMLMSSSLVASERNEAAKLQVLEDRYAFGSVPEGALVTCDFQIENIGTGPLALKKAVSSCSCLSIVSWDKSIAPGENGRISVSFNSGGYGGQEVVRTVTVQTNDPETPQLILKVSGRVDKLYSISPEIVKLTCHEGEESCQVVTIFPEEKYPFNVLGIRMKKGDHVECTIEEVEEDGRKGCCVTVRNTKKDKGLFFDKIYVDTDSAVVPEISIGVFGKIEAG